MFENKLCPKRFNAVSFLIIKNKKGIFVFTFHSYFPLIKRVNKLSFTSL